MAEYGFAEGVILGIEKRKEMDPSKQMTFDWDRAARLIREALLAGGNPCVEAGLSGDWNYTGGVIFQNGEMLSSSETYTFLSSFWAEPSIMMDGETQECWVWESDSPGWDSGTNWPESAINILNGGS